MCCVKRCKREAIVGIVPKGCTVARFLCRVHWEVLCEEGGSVCEQARAYEYRP